MLCVISAMDTGGAKTSLIKTCVHQTKIAESNLGEFKTDFHKTSKLSEYDIRNISRDL